MRRTLLLASLFSFVLAAFAQDAAPEQNVQPAANQQAIPVFKANVVGRTTEAVNWHHASGTTKVNLQGTQLMPDATGEARVKSESGRIRIETKIRGLGDPQQFGREYLTYVLFAITPEGRAQNLGEIIRSDKDKGETNTQTFTTTLQTFGLIITAEPYFAVSQPSDLVVMENIIRKDTVGATLPINVHYELISRGGYIPPQSTFAPLIIDQKLPFDLYEARNAVRIAQANGADHYATTAYQKAVDLLTQAEQYAARKHVQTKPVITVARAAVQQAEDARAIAVRREADERLANERALAAQREAVARQAAEEARRRSEQDAAARATAEQQSQQASLAQQQAQLQAQQAAAAQQQAELARQQAEQQQAAAQQQADAARQSAQQAQQEKEQLRHRLLQQFNTILVTRDTARGLIANLSDVLFATNSFQLRPEAKLALAKFSGIVLAYPGLNLQIEGNTDSTGTEAYNQRLSEKRADSVRDFLISQGLTGSNVNAVGLGQSNPIASNNTALGRKQNRRVEIVVSGDVIGQPIGQPAPVPPEANPAQPSPLPSSTGPTNPSPPGSPR